MPNLPLADVAGPLASGGNRAQSTPEAFGSQIGVAMQQAGKELLQVSDELKAKRERDDKLKAEKFLAEFHQEELLTMREEQEQETDPRGYTDRYVSGRDPRFEDRVQTLGLDAKTEEYLRLRYAQTVQTSTLRNALTYEHTASAQQTSELWDSILKDKSIIAFNDPGSLPDIVASFDVLADEQQLPANVRAAFKETFNANVAEAAINGLIKQSPNFALEALNDKDFDQYLSGDQKRQLTERAEAEIRAHVLEADRVRVARERQLKEEQLIVQNDLLIHHTNGTLTVPMVINSILPAFGTGSKKAFLDIIEQDVKDQTEPTRTNQRVMQSLFMGIVSGEVTDTAPLFDARGRGELSNPDFNFLQGVFRDGASPDGRRLSQVKDNFFKLHKAQIDKSTMFESVPLGNKRFNEFAWFVENEISRARESKIDPMELFNPQSKLFLGRGAVIGKFIPTIEELTQAQAMQPGATLPPVNPEAVETTIPESGDPRRRPGESWPEYKKRVDR